MPMPMNNMANVVDNQLITVTPNALDFSTSSTSGWHEDSVDSIVSDSAVFIINVVVFVVICGVLSTAGLVANAINVVVFFRLGALSSSSNVSLLALAFADLGSLISVLCTSVGLAIQFANLEGFNMHPREFMEVFTIWPHIMLVQIASWITAYIAFERCICVVFPFKVRLLFSAKRSLIVLVAIAVVFTAGFIPTFATLRFGEIQDPATNRTALVFLVSEVYEEIVLISDYIHAIVFRTLALVIVFGCTQVTVYYVKLSKSWRESMETPAPNIAQSSSSSSISTVQVSQGTRIETLTTNDDFKGHNQPEQDCSSVNAKNDDVRDRPLRRGAIPVPKRTKQIDHSSKERRLVKLITMISSIFIVCNTPDVVGVYVLRTVSFFNNLSPMDNLFHVLIAVQFCMETVNSAINILVYYRMSARYREEFRLLLRLD